MDKKWTKSGQKTDKKMDKKWTKNGQKTDKNEQKNGLNMDK